MPNGKPGDHPITDILAHRRRVYSDRIDGMVREIAALGGRRGIEDMLFLEFNDFSNPDLVRLEAVLDRILHRLRAEAKARGRGAQGGSDNTTRPGEEEAPLDRYDGGVPGLHYGCPGSAHSHSPRRGSGAVRTG